VPLVGAGGRSGASPTTAGWPWLGKALVRYRHIAARLAADRVPSVRAISAQLHIGQPRAQRIRVHLSVFIVNFKSYSGSVLFE